MISKISYKSVIFASLFLVICGCASKEEKLTPLEQHISTYQSYTNRTDQQIKELKDIVEKLKAAVKNLPTIEKNLKDQDNRFRAMDETLGKVRFHLHQHQNQHQ